MISIKVDDKQVQAMLKLLPKQASRAAEQALDFTAVRIADAVRTQMLRVFDRPTQFTLNSLKVTKTKGHNMTAGVGFKNPTRAGGTMTHHYLRPEVEGGKRKLKGFERGLGADEFVPGRGASMDGWGNVKVSQIKTALKEVKSGKSVKYVQLTRTTGKLPPGIYQRVKAEGSARRKRGAFMRGLKPILIKGRTGHSVRPLLPFYLIAYAEYAARFAPYFRAKLRESGWTR